MTDPSAPTPGPHAAESLDLASAWVDAALAPEEFLRASGSADVARLAETFADLRRSLAADTGPAPAAAPRESHIARALSAWAEIDEVDSPGAEVASLDAARERRAHRLGRVAAGVAAAAVVALGVVAIAGNGSRRTDVASSRAESTATPAQATNADRVNVAAAPESAAVSSTMLTAKAVSAGSDASGSAVGSVADTGSVDVAPWQVSTDADVVALVHTFESRPPAAPTGVCPGHAGAPVAAVSWRGHSAQLFVLTGPDKAASRQALILDSTTCAVLTSITVPAA